jgi:hypothetical protein
MAVRFPTLSGVSRHGERPEWYACGVSTMFSAKVKGGVIVAEDIDLPEGATVYRRPRRGYGERQRR